ncbi:uncharacterized protein [Maniola hyperantus]|uniref:uncharacterized protein n=1 Tax=Aphantopus hyperantus TaxID=2795564 RepID=UPI0037483605
MDHNQPSPGTHTSNELCIHSPHLLGLGQSLTPVLVVPKNSASTSTGTWELGVGSGSNGTDGHIYSVVTSTRWSHLLGGHIPSGHISVRFPPGCGGCGGCGGCCAQPQRPISVGHQPRAAFLLDNPLITRARTLRSAHRLPLAIECTGSIRFLVCSGGRSSEQQSAEQRLILSLVVCACAVAGAPQDSGGKSPPLAPDAASLEDSFGSTAPPSADTTALESGEFVRHARQGSFTPELEDPDTTETEELATDAITSPRSSPGRTFTRPARPTQASPRFISKLSYFDKPSAPSGVATNLLEKPDRGYPGYVRKFVSSCRCEKIWNCRNLQITTPRCPSEFFMCCDYNYIQKLT